ncbi:hypothetical protein LUZ60_005605 [Juncus effusus]|nr:hypothetical protein LUZ60_005605 [Juncus effusus]
MVEERVKREAAVNPAHVIRSPPIIVNPVHDINTNEYYYLSNHDQNIAVIMKTVHPYKATEKRTDDVYSVLRESLSRVSVHYYPYAGTLNVSQEGKLRVKCDGRGVPFVEAQTESAMEVLCDDDMSVLDPNKLGQLIYVDHEAKNILETPLLTVQGARTQGLKTRPDQLTKLLFSIDGRNRVKPPLPKEFWGNAIVTDELVHKPLSYAVKAIEQTDDAFIKSTIDYFEVTRTGPSLTATLLVTAWTKLGFTMSNFGWGGGEEFHAGSAELPQKEVVVFLPQIKETKSIKVVIGLPSPSMKAFEEIVAQLED